MEYKILIINDFNKEVLDALRIELGSKVSIDYRPDIQTELRAEHLNYFSYDIIALRGAKINNDVLDRIKCNVLFIRGGTKTTNLANVVDRYFDVQNTPGSNAKATAEMMLASIWYLLKKSCHPNSKYYSSTILEQLLISRQIEEANRRFHLKKSIYKGNEIFNQQESVAKLMNEQPLRGLKIFIIGASGHVGTQLLTLLSSAGASVTVWSPSLSKMRSDKNSYIIAKNIISGSKNADIICICTKAGENFIIDNSFFSKLIVGRKIIIVNVTSHDVFTTSAQRKLIAALKNNRIYYAIDHFVEPLSEISNVLMTPNIGAETYESQYKVSSQVAEQIKRKIYGRSPINLVQINPYYIYLASPENNARWKSVENHITCYNKQNAYFSFAELRRYASSCNMEDIEQLITYRPTRLLLHEVIIQTLNCVKYNSIHELYILIKKIYLSIFAKKSLFQDQCLANPHLNDEFKKRLYALEAKLHNIVSDQIIKFEKKENLVLKKHVFPKKARVFYILGASGVGKTTTANFIKSIVKSDSLTDIFFDPIRPFLTRLSKINEETLKKVSIDYEILTHLEVQHIAKKQTRHLLKLLEYEKLPEFICIDRVMLDVNFIKELARHSAYITVINVHLNTDSALKRVVKRGINGTKELGDYLKFNDTRTQLRWHQMAGEKLILNLLNLKDYNVNFFMIKNETEFDSTFNNIFLCCNTLEKIIYISDLTYFIYTYKKRFINIEAGCEKELFNYPIPDDFTLLSQITEMIFSEGFSLALYNNDVVYARVAKEDLLFDLSKKQNDNNDLNYFKKIANNHQENDIENNYLCRLTDSLNKIMSGLKSTNASD